MQKKIILITGASTGLGLSIVKQLSPNPDFFLVLTARKSSLYRFAKENIFESDNLWIRPMDVTSPFERESVVEEILNKFGRVDVLINNAGIAYRSVIEHIEPDELGRQMNTNFYSPLELIRLVLPSMRQQRAGHIVNISSVGGVMAMPTMGLYSASKFSLEAISEALWYELKPWNIKVSLVEPGFICSSSYMRVPWSRKALLVGGNEDYPYHKQYQSMVPLIARMMNLSFAPPSRIASKVQKVIEKKSPPLRVAVTFDAKVFSLLKKLLPQKLYHNLLYKLIPKSYSWGFSTSKESIFANFLLKDRHVYRKQLRPLR